MILYIIIKKTHLLLIQIIILYMYIKNILLLIYNYINKLILKDNIILLLLIQKLLFLFKVQISLETKNMKLFNDLDRNKKNKHLYLN